MQEIIIPDRKLYYEAPVWYFVLRDQETWVAGYNAALADVRAALPKGDRNEKEIRSN